MEVLGAGRQQDCPPLSQAPESKLLPRPLGINPLHLLLSQATTCLAMDPQRSPAARADFLPAVAAHHLQNSTHGHGHGRQRKTFPAVPQQVGLPRRNAQSCWAWLSLTALIPVNQLSLAVGKKSKWF